MDKKEKEIYEKKMRRYEKLGALKFQKVVFKVEEMKFKILKKCCPNFIYYFDKYCDWKQKRQIKHATTEEEVKDIKRRIKLAKMAMRKEFNQEKNRNYHMDSKRPTEIFGYLEWNKQVHQRGLIKDAVLIPILLAGTILQVPFAAPVLAYEVLSAFINFECINIQDYNLCRLERLRPTLEKREERRAQKSVEEFGEAAEVIHKSIEQSEKLPSFDEIIANIDNPEQLRQMRAMLKREHEERQAQKKIGGK